MELHECGGFLIHRMGTFYCSICLKLSDRIVFTGRDAYVEIPTKKAYDFHMRCHQKYDDVLRHRMASFDTYETFKCNKCDKICKCSEFAEHFESHLHQLFQIHKKTERCTFCGYHCLGKRSKKEHLIDCRESFENIIKGLQNQNYAKYLVLFAAKDTVSYFSMLDTFSVRQIVELLD